MKSRPAKSKSMLALAIVLLGGMAARAQQPPPPLTSDPCVPTKKDPCLTQTPPPPVKKPADEFPFPGDAPAGPARKPADEFPFPGDVPAAPAPNPGVKSDPDSPAGAAAAHPFPGDDGSSSSSSSSSGGSPDETPALKDEGSEGSTKASRRRLVKTEDPLTRELEDLKVSKFYRDTGNFKGAYMRAQDAVKYQPDDPEAHLALAETALKLQKKDEAIAEYKAFLKLDPDEDKAKSVRRKLEELK